MEVGLEVSGYGVAMARCIYRGVLMEVSVVDGAPRLLTEAGVRFGVVKGEVMESKVLELIGGESQDPGNVTWSDGECVVVCWDEGHGVMVK